MSDTSIVGGGGGGGLPGVTPNGNTPAGINVAGIVHAASYSADDVNQSSSFDGGILITGGAISINPGPGVDGFEVRWDDAGIGTLMYRAMSDGTNWFDSPIRLSGQIQTGQAVAHSLGAYSGNAVPIYAEDGITLLGYLPLYA